MSKFQSISRDFGFGMLGTAIAYATCAHYRSSVASALIGLSALIASGFAAAAGEK